MEIKVFDAEYRFMELLWERSPINSTELVKLCENQLGWKKSTTYTTIKRLSERKIVKNEKAMVSFLVSKEEVQIEKSKEHLNKLYNGSFKLLLTSFLQKEVLTEDEIKELKALIDEKVGEETDD
jgi:predicted transcriptional regulator